ncbi:IclR family transcriptional regulator [Lysinibacter cavernae]|uniref:DNA-binding IclR family transcriptional regulator n=1 Tax=Lysinibacter cavernae TaxID=1640652 RepID=A0A7X5R0L9_9MICO|nr:IclR family transcriptional regulator [Lysinibacter cavernae]NIH53225.1 DNA-binding IclR family transcriptional regulator [Lysinibacter cavernae]
MANSASGESMISRVARVVAALDDDHPGLTVSGLAEVTHLPIATTHRIVRDLVDIGWVHKDADGRVRLGLRLWEIVNRGSVARELRTVARPYMEDVHSVVKQHTQLGILEDGDVLFLECFSRRGSVDNAVTVAGRLPAHISSAGLVIMAFAPPAAQEVFLRANAMLVPDLRGRLEQIRRNGYAVVDGMLHANTSGIAVPIWDKSKFSVAALSVVVPRDPAEVNLAVPALLIAARGISRELGFRDPQRREAYAHEAATNPRNYQSMERRAG